MRKSIFALYMSTAITLAFYPALLNADAIAPAFQEHVVEIRQFKFEPETINAKPGDTITWVNKDIVPHTATSKDGSWDTGTLNKDESNSMTVTSNMASDYFCRFHVNMSGTIAPADRNDRAENASTKKIFTHQQSWRQHEISIR